MASVCEQWRFRSLATGLLLLVAAVPATANESVEFAVVSVLCPGEAARREHRLVSALRPAGNCRERLVAVIEPSVGSVATLAADHIRESTVIVEKPGWPRTFAAFSGGSLTLAELGDPRGLATVVEMEDGTVDAFTPDGQSLPGWPHSVPAVTDLNPAIAAVDLLGDTRDELLLAAGALHALSSEGELLPGWPFAGAGVLGTMPVGVRFSEDAWLRVVTAGRLPVPFPAPGAVFLLDEEGGVLPGWPAIVPPFVTPQGVFPPIFHGPAVGDVTGDGLGDVVIINSNDRGVRVFAADGSLVPPFPVMIGRILDAPSLGDLDADGTREIAFWTDRTNPDVRGSRGIIVLKSDGTTMPGWPQVTNSIGNGGPALGDVDGDGLLEVVVSTVGGTGGVFVWRHDGTLQPGWPKLIEFTTFPNPPAIGDVDGDGVGDVVVTGATTILPSDGVIYAWQGDGEPIAGFPIVVPLRPFLGNAAPTIADIDHDGIADLGAASLPGIFASKPARIHWFDLGVPYRAEGMEWPTWAHDMARTGSYSPPVQRVSIAADLLPPVIHSNTPAPRLTAIFRLPRDVSSMPTTFSLVKVDDEPVEPVEGQQLGRRLGGLGKSNRLVFRFDGQEVRSRLGSVSEHELTFRSEVIGGLGGVQYEGTATLTLGDGGRRFGWDQQVEDSEISRHQVPLTRSADPEGSQ